MAGKLSDPLPPALHLKRIELALEGTRLGLWDWNPTTDEVIFDERWAGMLGHSLDEITPELETWRSRVHPDDLEGAYRDLGNHMKGLTPFYENVHRMRHKDGHWVHILDRGCVVDRDEMGRPTRFTGTHTDITTQREAEAAAVELAEGRTRFLAAMSHEIRTPLHGVLGLLELIDRPAIGEENSEILALADRTCRSLVRLVEDILDFGRAAEGRLPVEAKDFALRQTIEECMQLFSSKAQTKGIELSCALDDSLTPFASGDEARLRQVLSNLISNAVKFTREGSVRVHARRAQQDREEVVIIEVTDTGPGIDDVARVFRPYEQGAASVAERYAGAGLGLAIVKQLAEAMGGSISLCSEVGKGSTFALHLPLPEAEAGEAVTPAPVADIQPVRVLIADDNPINQVVGKMMLSRLGHQVTVAADGREALKEMRASSCDLIFLDLNMPDFDGFEVMRALHTEGRRARVVAATADASRETRQRCVAEGFTGFIAKPFDLKTLRQVVGQALATQLT